MSAERLVVIDLAASSRNWSLPEWGRAAILAEAPPGWRVRVVGAPTVSDGDGGTAPSAEALDAVREAEVYFGFGMPRALFAAAPRLRWIQSAAAGVGNLLYPEMLARPVQLTNSAGVHAVPIAEHVLGGVIYLLRSFDVATALHRAGRWDKTPFIADEARMREVGDCRVLVVGTGGIGREVGRRFAFLGAECVGIRRHPERGAPEGFARVAGPDALDELLPSADVVVLSAPLTPETDALLTAERLDLLPRDGIVVNVARGMLLDEGALAERLASGRLRGAVLDVFREEPLPETSPLWSLPQVLLTPHVAAVSPRRFWERELALFFENWRRYRAGAPLLNGVDKDAGY